MPSHTIASTGSGVTLTPAGYYNPATVEAGIIISSPSVAIYAPTEWAIYNLGTVTDAGADGIRLQQGGTVINGQAGSTVAAAYIGGTGEAVYITGASGSVANYGTIQGTGDGVFLGQGGTVTNGGSGATAARIVGFTGVLGAGANYLTTVANDATISGTSFDGVLLAGGGNVTNGAEDPTASTALIAGVLYGVYIKGNIGTLTNFGTVQGTDNYGARIDGGGSLVNGVAGANAALITGGGGVLAIGSSLAVTNYGSIHGNNTAIVLNNSGSVDNAQAAAVISGLNTGVDIFGFGSVTNSGTITGTTLIGIELFDGGNVTNGASAATISAALISGGYYGIRIGFNNGAMGTVTNFGTVIGNGAHGQPPNDAYSAVFIAGLGTVLNSGIIRDDATNSFDRAVRLNGGGYVNNAASGTIAGDSVGVYVGGAAGTVENAGSISGLNSNGGEGILLKAGGSVDNSASTATIRGAFNGVEIAGGSGTVSNIGTISGTFSPGVELAQGGSVLNGQSGTTLGAIYGYGFGVYIYGPTSGGTSLGAGTVTNYGRIVGHDLVGVDLLDGGSVTNSGYISGGVYGVVTDFFDSPATNIIGTVVNSGTILGGASNGAGVALRSGGTVVNASGATISGGYGVLATGPNGVGLTVVNAGTIHGTGHNHVAVLFEASNDVVVDTPGAVFDGYVAANGSSTLILASAASIGTITGFGIDFQFFGTLSVEAGAQWSMSGSNTIVVSTPLNVGSKADLEVTGTLAGSAQVTLSGGTIGFASQVDASDTFAFADTGGVQPSSLALGTTDGTDFNNAISSFGGGDQITISDVTFVAGSTPIFSGGTLSVDLVGGGTFSFGDFAFEGGTADPLLVTDHAVTDMACFVAGTAILTEQGEVPVEALRSGDRVVTLNGSLRPVRWIGQRRIDLTRHPDRRRAQPICIRPNAFAEGMPVRDLFVSPDHALYIDGALMPARQLINGATIVQASDCRRVHYFHVELEAHDILFAEAMAAESYLDTGNRAMFENADEALILHPEFAVADGQRRREAGSCLPLVSEPARAASLWRLLAERAKQMGYAVPTPVTTSDPGLTLLVDGSAVHPAISGGRHNFVPPRGARSVRLISRANAPCDVAPWIEDRRQLGIMLRGLTLHTDNRALPIPLDHPVLTEGWWPVEHHGDSEWRWSDGNARLVLPEGCTRLELDVGTPMPYLVSAARRAA